MPEPEGEESRDIKDAHPLLQAAWPKIRAAYQELMPGRDLFITCTWRSVNRQKELFAQGRTTPGDVVTWVDGVTKKSLHNAYPARAIDVCVDEDADVTKVKVSYDWRLYSALDEICTGLNLEWGGNWSEKKRDRPHIQIP